ncbi:hypothetical protein [Thermococcus sp.]
MTTIPEEPEDPLICPSPGIALFIFEPSGNSTYEPISFGDAYLTDGPESYGGISLTLMVSPVGMSGKEAAAIKVGVPENGTGIRVLSNSSKPGVMILIDPETGKKIDRITPDKRGVYRIPEIDGEVIGFVAKADPPNGGFCYRPLELNINTTLEPMEVCEQEFTVMTIIFEPSTENTFEQVARADLKQLAEQLVNFNIATARIAGGNAGATGLQVNEALRSQGIDDLRGIIPMRTGEFAAFRMERGDISPFLTDVLGGFGTGPFIPPVELRAVGSGKGIIVAVTGPAMASKMPPEYLGGTFLEV